MKSRTTKSFWKYYWALPVEIRQRARQTYKVWRDNPKHPSLFFKRIKQNQQLYSVRISRAYRAIGLRKANTVTWFWIGTHDEYDHIIK